MADQRRRILLVTRNLPPLLGGMEKLNWHLAAELSAYADVRVVGPLGSAAQAPPSVVVREVPLSPLWRFLLGARQSARNEARRWQPDFVIAGSGLTAPLARAAACCCGAKVAVYVHGLDVAVRHPVYRGLWLPAIRRADYVVANSRATARLCRNIGVEEVRITIVPPGVTMPDKDNLKSGNAASSGLARGPILLSVGRLSARKGLLEFVSHALPAIVNAHPGSTLQIVGEMPRNALHAKAQTPERIKAAAKAAGIADNVEFLGPIMDDKRLGAIYAQADVHVFPVREIAGDPEGFGMVAVEAAAHGLPTVAFATGGVVDAVAEGVSGYLAAPGDYAAFAAAVARAMDQRKGLEASCIEFARGFAWPVFGHGVAAVLDLV